MKEAHFTSTTSVMELNETSASIPSYFPIESINIWWNLQNQCHSMAWKSINSIVNKWTATKHTRFSGVISDVVQWLHIYTYGIRDIPWRYKNRLSKQKTRKKMITFIVHHTFHNHISSKMSKTVFREVPCHENSNKKCHIHENDWKTQISGSTILYYCSTTTRTTKIHWKEARIQCNVISKTAKNRIWWINFNFSGGCKYEWEQYFCIK